MPAPVVRTDALQSQISSLGERLERGFTEVKEMLQGFEARVRGVEQAAAGLRGESRLAALELHQQNTDKELEVIRETVIELRHTNKILTWIGGLLGSSIILWFVGQLLGLIK